MADHAYEIGDWSTAETLYRQVVPSSQTQQEIQTLGLARTLMGQGALSEAIALLKSLINTGAQGATLTEAHLHLADALMQQDDPTSAAQHYQAVAQAYPILAPYAYQWLGDAHFEAGAYEAAVTAYQTGLEATSLPVQQVFLWEKLAWAHSRLGAYEETMAAYDAILTIAQIAEYRGRIMYQAAETALIFDEPEEAYQRMQELVLTYPTQSYAYEALVKLVQADRPVDDLLRGKVDYYAGAYVPAVEAFQRVIDTDPAHDGEPHYYMGLSYLENGAPALALDAFEILIETHPEDAYWGSAWIGKARALIAQDDLDAAIAAYRALPEALPDHPRAPAALWSVAELLQDAGRWLEAAEAFLDLAARYPNDEGAPLARFNAGLLHYRDYQAFTQSESGAITRVRQDLPTHVGQGLPTHVGQGLPTHVGQDLTTHVGQDLTTHVGQGLPTEALDRARQAWWDLVDWYPNDDHAQGALFWLGKTYIETGAQVSATKTLSRAVTFAPWSYYGLRAADLMKGQPPFAVTSRSNVLDQSSLQCGDYTQQVEAEVWLASWLNLGPTTTLAIQDGTLSLATPSPALLDDPRLRRGQLLLRLGHFNEGREQLEALREATVNDALTQYQLALIFRDIGLYRSSIIAAATVWRHSPSFDVTTLPRFLGCLIYPTYFSDLVASNAAMFDLHPLVIYALLRQESLFEGFATSYAAAHGLMQVIPSTGASIATALGWPPDYKTSDLYRPMVSVRFGIWYLAQQRDRFDGNLYAAMAGYNGGPDNAARWLETANGDTDLFVELIGFRETRTYVRRITEHFAKYRWLYDE
jgi:soluble lytic murein transglycosylase